MQNIRTSGKEKIHTRTITISTFEHDDQRIIVEGFLKDDRYMDTYAITGETFPRGTIHHMTIRLLINCSTLVIEDLDMELLHVPRDVCLETRGFLAPAKGMSISRGFTSRIKKEFGGSRGCTHVLELLLAMAPAVTQGLDTHQARNRISVDSEQAQKALKYLFNACHTWREDGIVAQKYKKMIETKTKAEA